MTIFTDLGVLRPVWAAEEEEVVEEEEEEKVKIEVIEH